ncbi:MAG: hypothetical protein QMC96_09785 [Methanomicrobiales archaeon]|nr:hypothetical protein [Methanomicrobiales archaeon]
MGSPWLETYSIPNRSVAYENGLVILTDASGEYGTVYLLNQTYDDFLLDIDTEMPRGDPNSTVIIACRIDESFNRYEFGILDRFYAKIKNRTIRA